MWPFKLKPASALLWCVVLFIMLYYSAFAFVDGIYWSCCSIEMAVQHGTDLYLSIPSLLKWKLYSITNQKQHSSLGVRFFAIHVLVILKLTTEHETNQTSVKEKDMLSLTWRTCVLSQAIVFQLLASGFFRINWFHISTLLMQAVIQIFLRECKISWMFAVALRFYFWRDERRPRRSVGFDRRGLHFLTKWTTMSFWHKMYTFVEVCL